MKIWDKARLLFNNSAWDDMVRAFVAGDDFPAANGQRLITPEVAMTYTALFGCVRVLSETLAAMPIMLYRKKAGGDREVVNNLPIYDVLHNQPNGEMSPFSFKEACMISLNLGGNTVSEKIYSQNGAIMGVYPYHWSMVRIERDDGGRLVYIIKQGNEERKLARDRVFHIPGLSFDGVIGVSPIEYAANTIRLGLNFESFGNKFYQNGANASGVFTFPGKMSDDAFQRLKSDLTKNYTGMANLGRPMILEEGADFRQLTIKPADAQLIESRKFQTEDIARIYRVPLHLIQNLDKATFSNIEQQSLEFVMYTMLPWFKRWEEAINSQLLTLKDRQDGYYAEFKIDSLLRGDAKSRAEAYAAGRQWGWLSVNDIRKLENMSPIPNGDIYLTPANMYEAGQQPSEPSQAMAHQIQQMISEGR